VEDGSLVDLLERDGPLAALIQARARAAKGHGSVVVVSGEPGIGKTALMAHFAEEVGEGARVLWGTCDDLSIPRPLGPIRDLEGTVSAKLAEAAVSSNDFHHVPDLLLEELDARPAPTVLVIEDLHWADEATIDVITVVGRRIDRVPAIMVLTFRGGELNPDHPLHAALEAIRAEISLYLQLAPLSPEAVAALAGEDAERVYQATGGNPFYVTELVAALPEDLPPSVTNAVLGRVSRLADRAQRLMELVSVVPTRIPTTLLDAVMPAWAVAAEEPERRQLLSVDRHHVRFRHELARSATRMSLPEARRRQLHAQILRVLLDSGADPADIVYHAEQAGDTDVVASHALIAARSAGAVESNREAFAHYLRASEFADRLAPAEQAALFEELAGSAYTVGRLSEAMPAIERAIGIHGDLGDVMAVGRCTRLLSRFHWYAGNGPAAREAGERAISLLLPLGDTVELARAYSGQSQLAMLEGDVNETEIWGSKALALADQLNDAGVKAHALVNIGSIRMQQDADARAELTEAFELADRIGDRHEATRALLNAAYSAMAMVRPDISWEYAQRAIAYAEEHQVDTLLLYARHISAWLHVEEGAWAEAERVVGRAADAGPSVAQLLARTVLTSLAVRRGDADAPERIAGLVEQAELTGELERIGPALQLETEWALTTGAAFPLQQFEESRRLLTKAGGAGWAGSLVAAWGAVAGVRLAFEGNAPAPHRAMIDGDWSHAADLFSEVGWEYSQALMLSLLDTHEALDAAIEVARRLGAPPLERRVSRRMRDLDFSIPRRPLEATLANPASLTPRQAEVLELLAEGLTNAELADRLYVSPRTAEHHVQAILTKLGVSTRREAARRYQDLMRN
jgi:DNA-binding CsgD family transcriptional regulator/tetratricopeptide (TPR) repeat protein